MNDKQIEKLIKTETLRQKQTINLIASENFTSNDVRQALGSVFVNKYAEGYPKARYYGGNQVVDKLEELCIKRALKLFKLSAYRWAVNVQPYSGSPANMAVYLALASTHDKIMGLDLRAGGHLTHGHKVSASGKLWSAVSFDVDPKTQQLNYDKLEKIALKAKPKIIIAGFTAYPRKINWRRFKSIAKMVDAYLMVDASHVAGLIAGQVYPSPFPYADVVTMTTHKTLRGPRGAMIFSRRDKRGIFKKIDRAVFPGLQGGPHENQIAAMAVCLDEAIKPEFKKYTSQVIKNAQTLVRELKKRNWEIITGGTDSHLLLVDVFNSTNGRLTGSQAEKILETAGIIVNKNSLPFDSRPPTDPSGIRLGTAAETTRGKTEKDFKNIAIIIDKLLRYEN